MRMMYQFIKDTKEFLGKYIRMHDQEKKIDKRKEKGLNVAALLFCVGTNQYACRKTLADNRTRIRGRFARNDEIREIPKAPCSSSTTEEYEDEFWVNKILIYCSS